MCENVGVGVRVFPRCEDGTWVEGGGVIWVSTVSTRLDWSLLIEVAALFGIVACDG